jgi:hypothetical protein
MLGLSILKTKELERLRNIDEVFNPTIASYKKSIISLEERVKKLTRMRDSKGKFQKEITN